MEICVDQVGYYSSDFEGFRFYEIDGTMTLISAGCNDWHFVDLSSYRLIGFKTTVSDYIGGRRNIREITPIIDQEYELGSS